MATLWEVGRGRGFAARVPPAVGRGAAVGGSAVRGLAVPVEGVPGAGRDVGRDAPALPGADAAPDVDGGRRGPGGDERGRVGRGREEDACRGDCPAPADALPGGDGRARAGDTPGAGCRARADGVPDAGVAGDGAPDGGRAGPDSPVPRRSGSSLGFSEATGPDRVPARRSGARASTPPPGEPVEPAEPAEPTVRTAVSGGSSA
ncbi:hypothetical protein ACFZB2_20705 [Streptomyces bobili]|uniref:hypothetical protein n=1 Tax=Streptomyces bobili TaxID=67280 RepID=UPI0036EDD5D2